MTVYPKEVLKDEKQTVKQAGIFKAVVLLKPEAI
jgi:hypothetical protein